MALLDRLYSASFNGIPFLMSSSDMSYARETVTHEYPNKKFRYVLREAFIISLQMKGVGILIHPFYGALTVVVKNYTVSEDMTRVGECIFTITFQEAYLNIFPEFLGINISGFDDMIEQISQNTADFLRDNI